MSFTSGDLDAFFQAGSPLEGALAGFAPRAEQLEMARFVFAAMATGNHLAVEAGAGTGKTLAYLVPALLSGQRVIIATATRTLQDQLYHRDLPLVCGVLGRPVKVAQLKGRANYLCRYRLERAAAAPEAAGAREQAGLRHIAAWAAGTRTGDIAEVDALAEDSRLWPLVTSTADNCLGGRCPDFEACHVVAARKRAAVADVAIVNHHLLLADLALQDEGLGRLLPGAEVVVVDEAHRFPETAQAWFDVRLGSRQLDELVRDTAEEARRAGSLDQPLRNRLDAVLALARDMLDAAPQGGEPVPMSAVSPAFADLLESLAQALADLQVLLAGCAEPGAGLGRCAERCAALAAAAERIAAWEPQAELCWVQAVRDRLSLQLTPLDTSRQLRALLEGQSCTWIFTSATLAVGDDFSHFTTRLGLDPIAVQRIDSPFDYAGCARLYLPRGVPMPQAADYTAHCLAAVRPVLEASGGRAFLLFTSRRALQEAAALLAADAGDYHLLVQGSAPRSSLLADFLRIGNAVLLGTATFWEGVDIRGSALVVVVIDRLPFAAPGDPLLQARLEQVRRNGGDPFRDYQLPQAVLALRQGVGRLIRGMADYGIVIICDPRLRTRGYGRVFLRSLPPMPVVETAEAACRFLEERERERA
ncbi:MAG: ATP-dependent DNA helicase [Gammaproteobacteria bacterium]|nr:ATP-dependent DNA helicase [Gammaproteobacteria bacterium]